MSQMSLNSDQDLVGDNLRDRQISIRHKIISILLKPLNFRWLDMIWTTNLFARKASIWEDQEKERKALQANQLTRKNKN